MATSFYCIHLLLFYIVFINLLVLSCFAISVICISLSSLILIMIDSLFICIISNNTSCVYVYLSIVNRDALLQNNSCNYVGHNRYSNFYNDDEVLNYYVLPWSNYPPPPLTVYKLFYILFYFTLLCTNLSKCNFDFVMKLNITFLACILKLFLIDSANHIIDILQIAYNIYMYLYT